MKVRTVGYLLCGGVVLALWFAAGVPIPSGSALPVLLLAVGAVLLGGGAWGAAFRQR